MKFHIPTHLFEIHFNIVLLSTRWTSQAISALDVFPLKFCLHFSFAPCVLDLGTRTMLDEEYINYKISHFAVFSTR